MTLPRQKSREIVFLLLFSLDVTENVEDELVDMIMQELKVTKKSVYAELEKAKAILLEKESFDEMIQEATLSYDLDRIPRVEKNLLRLSLFEARTIPGKVALSEAIRLSKKFSSPESVSFINAILDNLMKKYGYLDP